MRATPDLIAECAAAPDDDEPRLVWADAIGGERGELVVLQCALARGGASPHESARRRKRVRDLVNQHGRAWSELRGIASRCTFRRGFVDAIEVEAFDAERVFAVAPFVTSVTMFDGLPPPTDRRIVAIDSARGHVIDPDSFGHLRALAVYSTDQISQFDVSRLERLWIREPAVDQQFTRVLDRATSLTALSLNVPSYEVLEHIPASVIELSIYGNGAPWDPLLAALARLPIGRTLERLRLARVAIGHDVLGRFPRLISLDVGDALSTGAVDRLAAAEWPALRELRMFSNVTPEAGKPWVDRLAPQLELFDVRANSHYQDQSPMIDADVVALSRSHTYLTAGDRAPEPWWDRVAVPLGR